MAPSPRLAPQITVYEVGPRDGLQNEACVLSTEDKLRLLRLLADAGLSRIEATSFVSPRWIPALADAEAVVKGLEPRDGLRYGALVPNAVGLARLAAALDAVGPGAPPVDAAVFLSASETHNRKNVGRSVDASLAGFEEVVAPAKARGLQVRGYLSMVWGCPFEGDVAPERVLDLARRLLALGCDQVSLGDTVGVGTPGQTRRILELLLGEIPADRLALHMHDTRGTALANVLVGLELGLTTFDAAVGGLGGCPYAPGASGNLATEDLVYMLHGMGHRTGVDWPLLIAAGELAERLVGHPLPGKALRAERARRVLLAASG